MSVARVRTGVLAASLLVGGLACGDLGSRSVDDEGEAGGEGASSNSGVTSAGVTGVSASGDSGGSRGDTSEESADTGGVSEVGADSGSDDGREFVPESDTGEGCGMDCDLWNPDDCPEGEKCTAVSCASGSSGWDSNVCREVQGNAQVGDPCSYTDGNGLSGNDTCAEGSMCFDADPETMIGTCIAFCTGSPNDPQCPSGSGCAITGSGVLALCFPGCDPLAQDCESSSELCLPDLFGDNYVCVINASGDMAPYGTACNYTNACNPGLLCIDPAGVPEPGCDTALGCCSPMCSISAGLPCPGEGQTCEPVFESQPQGYEDVGMCTIAS